MRFVSSLSFLVCASAIYATADDLRSSVLRSAALENGLVKISDLLVSVDKKKVDAGRLLFSSKEISLTREISCQNCHLDKFASADGIPLGIGTRGEGEGASRIAHGGDMLPRNTLPFWGRGSKGFETFFWDGRVQLKNNGIVSQFGSSPPSDDPLIVAAHLPPAQIKEMIRDDENSEVLRTETYVSSDLIYEEIASRVRSDEKLSASIISAFSIEKNEIKYFHIASSLAAFIRDRFQLQQTKFHEFVFNNIKLNRDEIEGGLIFYGRGKCFSCHSGPYFTDFNFHAIPFAQLGRGANGFGVDLGRYNVTANPNDLYKFRTPPLYNVSKTGPYSHSGSEPKLSEAIWLHVDPLRTFQSPYSEVKLRPDIYKKFLVWLKEPISGVELDERDVGLLVSFLKTLDFEDVNGAQ